MPLLLSKTYEEWDESALEAGDTDSRGFEWEDSPHTVREAAQLLKGRTPSQSPIVDPARCWFSDSDTDWRTGDETVTAVHFAHANRPHALRYWRAAIRAAGFTLKD